MILLSRSARLPDPGCCLLLGALLTFLVAGDAARAQQGRVEVLKIGSSGTFSTARGPNDRGALESLQSFIKDETGFDNEILVQKSWRELADKMAGGELHLGVFQGYEFAWAREKYPALAPLALAVNVYRYPT